MAYYGNILEEELKNKVAGDLFAGFDTTQIISRIDFCVSIPADPLGLNEAEPLLWAEAKKGTNHDIYESFIKLILTLGKELLTDTLHNGLEIYNFERDAKELVYFIRRNFLQRKQGVRHIRINKNNFTHIYLKWLEAVKPTININWEIANYLYSQQ